MNEWKALENVFKRTPRTEDLFYVLDRYETALAAFEGGNDGIIVREQDAVRATLVHKFVVIAVAKTGRIAVLTVFGLGDWDIVDLSYLPKDLCLLGLYGGALTRFDLSKVPRGLEVLNLENNEISSMMVDCAPSTLNGLSLVGNPLKQEGVVLKLPMPSNLEVFVPEIEAMDLKGKHTRELVPTIRGRNWEVSWEDGRSIRVFVSP